MDSQSEQKVRSLISQLQSTDNTESDNISLMVQIMSLFKSMDLDLQPKPESEFMSVVTQTISFFSSLALDSQPRPFPGLVSLVSEKISLHNSIDLYSEPKLRSLICQLISEPKLIPLNKTRDSDSGSYSESEVESDVESVLESTFVSVMIEIISLVGSMNLNSQPKPESELMSLVTQGISLFNSLDLDSQPKPLSKFITLMSEKISLHNSLDSDLERDSELMSLFEEIKGLKPLQKTSEPELELILVIRQVLSLFISADEMGSDSDSESELDPDLELEPELKLLRLVTQLAAEDITGNRDCLEVIPLTIQIISFISMDLDLDLLPKPESEFMSLVSQVISVFSSMDLNSQPKHLSKLISFFSQKISLTNYSPDFEQRWKISSLIKEILDLEPEPKLISLIYKIFSLVISKNSKYRKIISLCPKVKVTFEKGGQIVEEILVRSDDKWKCLYGKWQMYSTTGRYATHFFCKHCNGENHEEYSKAPFEIKHPLHPKHPLQLVLSRRCSNDFLCYCCDQPLEDAIYYCSTCKIAISLACVKKQPLLSIRRSKWHEHKLALFPSQASFTCNVCALKHSKCPFYICPPCDFVVHQSCIDLPLVIRISRHLHRISYTPSFHQGDWFCGVCRRKIDNDYGGYSCIKEGCFYAAHSKCATQRNVWNGEDLEGQPEEIEEEVLEPFVRISDGIIQHFSHQHHHLRLGDITGKEYDGYQLCKACIMPVYYGNFYSCMECEFILHEICANHPRKIYVPLHPHLLTLVTADTNEINVISCSACPWLCTGFFYVCDPIWCYFKVHVQCATISEPLVHGSHTYPLFLTSKPGERRTCGVCNDSRRLSAHSVYSYTSETFNCIDCDFALCFGCATIPHIVRYRHDKHLLTLSYGEETSTMMLWCEVCEGEVNTRERFYRCDEYCCVTLHIECAVEKDLYMKPGLSLSYRRNKIVNVLTNNHRTSRPFCTSCGEGKRCQYNYYFKLHKSVYCTLREAFLSTTSNRTEGE